MYFEAIAQCAQRIHVEFLLLMGHHLALGALAEPEALHGLREDDRRLALRAHRGRDVIRICTSRFRLGYDCRMRRALGRTTWWAIVLAPFTNALVDRHGFAWINEDLGLWSIETASARLRAPRKR